MKIRPLQDRILVKRVAEEEKTKGGIIIPDSAKEKPSEGEVVAVAPARPTRRAWFAPSTSRRATGSSSASTAATR